MDTLKWEAFKSLKDLKGLSKQSLAISAIYMWGWKDKNQNFFCYYVGKTNNLYTRIFQHLGSLKGGLYTIYSKEFLQSGNFKNLKEVDNQNILYIPTGLDTFINEFLKKDEIINTVNWLIENILFTWTVTNKSNNADLEKFVAKQVIKKQKFIGSSVKGQSTIAALKYEGNQSILDLLE
jgi:hypothetical protein